MRRSALVLALAAAPWTTGCALRPPEPVPPPQPPALELRIADPSPRPGWLGIPNPHEPGTLFLDPSAVVTTRDLARADAAPTAEGLRLDLWLTDSGAERLDRATGENVGDWLAVVVEGEVRSAAVIAQRIAAGDAPLQIPLRMPAAEALRLRERIQAAWP